MVVAVAMVEGLLNARRSLLCSLYIFPRIVLVVMVYVVTYTTS